MSQLVLGVLAVCGGVMLGCDDIYVQPLVDPEPLPDGGDAGSCPPPFQICDEMCVNPRNDETNCGECGTTCRTGEACANGVCQN
jgi:hypothetical protein